MSALVRPAFAAGSAGEGMSALASSLFAATSAASAESKLIEFLEQGRIDSAYALGAQFPKGSPGELFLKALRERDGRVAAGGYAKVAAAERSELRPFAIERLIRYYEASGDSASAQRHRQALGKTARGFDPPDYGWSRADRSAQEGSQPAESKRELSDSKESPKPTSPTAPEPDSRWRVQIGAFRNQKAAEAAGRRVARFGKPYYIEKATEGATLVAVQIGDCPTKFEANALAESIAASTGQEVVVVRVK